MANTQKPLYLVNRPGNRPSHEHAAIYDDAAIRLLHGAGFRTITFRGDTDFTQTKKLDEWDAQGVRFIFGIDAMKNLVELADNLPKPEWKPLERRAKYDVKTQPRRRPDNVKERIVKENAYENIRLNGEDVAEFAYQPGACKKTYRIVVVRKDLTVERGEEWLFDDHKYFFYITNDEASGCDAIVYEANDRCRQENLIEQLKNGVHAMNMPVKGIRLPFLPKLGEHGSDAGRNNGVSGEDCSWASFLPWRFARRQPPCFSEVWFPFRSSTNRIFCFHWLTDWGRRFP